MHASQAQSCSFASFFNFVSFVIFYLRKSYELKSVWPNYYNCEVIEFFLSSMHRLIHGHNCYAILFIQTFVIQLFFFLNCNSFQFIDFICLCPHCCIPSKLAQQTCQINIKFRIKYFIFKFLFVVDLNFHENVVIKYNKLIHLT